METQTQESKISVEQRGHILLIGLNRPAKRNAFDIQMLNELADAYTRLENTEELRCGVLFRARRNVYGRLGSGKCRAGSDEIERRFEIRKRFD